MDLGQFVSEGWQKHAEDEQGVFDSLPEGVALVTEAKHAPMLAGLVVHVAGEHLGRWSDGLELVGRLEEHESVESGSPAWKSLQRSKAVLHHCAGDGDARDACIAAGSDPDHPESSGRVRVMAIASSALLGQKRIDDAMAAFGEATDLAAYGPVKGDPAAIGLAVAGNNIACALEDSKERSDAASALMLKAAQAGRTYWEIAGTWTNVERAEYRLAMTNLQLGDADAALRHAQSCLSVCNVNDADPGELFFAREALTKAWHAKGSATAAKENRDAAAAQVAAVKDEGFRSYCEGELAKLDALLG